MDKVIIGIAMFCLFGFYVACTSLTGGARALALDSAYADGARAAFDCVHSHLARNASNGQTITSREGLFVEALECVKNHPDRPMQQEREYEIPPETI